jgi:ankyrin repeat protein
MLSYTCQFGYLELVKYLSDNSTTVFSNRNKRRIPLHLALKSGHEAVALLLLDEGADVSAADSDGWMPLFRALQKRLEVVVWFADVSAANNYGNTPLHFTSQKGLEAVAWLLLDKGADVSAVNADGNTPLHRAWWKGHEAAAQLLLDNNADVSAADCNENTLIEYNAKVQIDWLKSNEEYPK